ncbi:MAG: SWIM zinc finger family protein [Erysipelotrichaceae bacterium]|nr:SWIM zinc finger family protein [Erysipelotrichaceae bacterium]
MNWEDEFRGIIVGRGYDYFLSNRIEDYHETDKLISATVTGTNNYDVQIRYNKKRIMGMTCTCPYAAKGFNCKHMAAVLFKWDENHADKEIEEDDVTIEDVMQQASNEQINEFLLDLLQQDTNLALKFKTMICHKVSQKDMRNYKASIDSIIDSYVVYDTVDYYHAYDFMHDINTYLKENVDLLLQSECYFNAFDLSSYAFEKINVLDMDDSGGEKTTFVCVCTGIWDNIISRADAATIDKMFQWFLDYLDGSDFAYLEHHLLDYLMNHFKEKKYLQIKLTYIKKQMSDDYLIEEYGYYDYLFINWAKNYLQVMIELNLSENEIKLYCDKYWEYAEIRQMYITYCINHQQYDNAIIALNESILSNNGNHHITDYRHQLKDIYLTLGNDKEYKDQLWLLVILDNPGNVDDFKELKALYTNEQWQEIREGIFMIIHDDCDMAPLYKEEKIYDCLLDIVLNDSGLYKLWQYEDVLKEVFPQELLQKYTKELNEMAYRSATRRQYQQWVQYMEKMKKIDGGEKAIQQIVNDWKVRYRNRPALMEELSRL